MRFSIEFLAVIILSLGLSASQLTAQMPAKPSDLERLDRLTRAVESLVAWGALAKDPIFARQSLAKTRSEKRLWRALAKAVDGSSKTPAVDDRRWPQKSVDELVESLSELSPISLPMIEKVETRWARLSATSPGALRYRLGFLKQHLLFELGKSRLEPWRDKGYYDDLFRSPSAEQAHWCAAFFQVLEATEPGLHHLALQGLIDNTDLAARPQVVKRLQELRIASLARDAQASLIDVTLARLGYRRHYQARVKKLSIFIRSEAAKGDKASLLKILEAEEKLADLFVGLRDHLNAAIAYMDYLDILLPNFEGRTVAQIPQAWLAKTQRQFYSLACSATGLGRLELALYALEMSFSYGGPYLDWSREDVDLKKLRGHKSFNPMLDAWRSDKKPGDAKSRPKFFAVEKKALAALRAVQELFAASLQDQGIYSDRARAFWGLFHWGFGGIVKRALG